MNENEEDNGATRVKENTRNQNAYTENVFFTIPGTVSVTQQYG